MARIAGINIPMNKHVVIGLTHIFGIGNSPNPNVIQQTLQKIAAILNYGQPLHVVLFGLLVVGFAFFYVALVYDARDTAENLKKAGAFIPGIRRANDVNDAAPPHDFAVLADLFDGRSNFHFLAPMPRRLAFFIRPSYCCDIM